MSDISTTDPTTGRRPGVRGARRHAHPGLVLLVIAGAQLMVVLDGTIVNIALPSMGRYFDKSQTDMTWALNAASSAASRRRTRSCWPAASCRAWAARSPPPLLCR